MSSALPPLWQSSPTQALQTLNASDVMNSVHAAATVASAKAGSSICPRSCTSHRGHQPYYKVGLLLMMTERDPECSGNEIE